MSTVDSGVDTGTEEESNDMSVESPSSDHSSLNDPASSISFPSESEDNPLSSNTEDSNEEPNAQPAGVIQRTSLSGPSGISLASCCSSLSVPQSRSMELLGATSSAVSNVASSSGVKPECTNLVMNKYLLNPDLNFKLVQVSPPFLSKHLVFSQLFGIHPEYSQHAIQGKIRSIGPSARSRKDRNSNFISNEIYSTLNCRKMRIAANNNNVEAVKKLLMNGVNPLSCDEKMRTPLHIAASQGYTDIVKLLLEFQANPNSKDVVGNTPLHLAVIKSHIEIITLLLNAGTDIKTIDNRGRTPLELAKARLMRIKSGNYSNSVELKAEVMQIVKMMQAYLHKTGQSADAEFLNMFSNCLSLRQTKDEVDKDVQELLSSFGHLSIEKPNS